MTMKPILFNTDMVKAILDGQKTETRRVVREPYRIDDEKLSRVSGLALHAGTDATDRMPYPDSLYSVNDLLYVRETWSQTENGQDYLYRADAVGNAVKDRSGRWHVPKWRPSLHMPKEAARIFLRVTDVRVEMLQEITEVGARNEGAEMIQNARGLWSYRKGFETIWNSTLKHMDHVRYGWTANPWVWVISFERYEMPAGWPDIE